jgi:hypothetical protein
VVYSIYKDYLGSSSVSWCRNRSFDRYEPFDGDKPVVAHRKKASLSTLYFILWFSYPENHYYMAFAFVMGGIYANSLMVVFNSRTMISDRRAERQFVDDVEADLFKGTETVGRGEQTRGVSCNMGSVSGGVALTSSKLGPPSRGDERDEDNKV